MSQRSIDFARKEILAAALGFADGGARWAVADDHDPFAELLVIADRRRPPGPATRPGVLIDVYRMQRIGDVYHIVVAKEKALLAFCHHLDAVLTESSRFEDRVDGHVADIRAAVQEIEAMLVRLGVVIGESSLHQPAAGDRGSPGNRCADFQKLTTWKTRCSCHLGRLLNVGLFASCRNSAQWLRQLLKAIITIVPS